MYTAELCQYRWLKESVIRDRALAGIRNRSLSECLRFVPGPNDLKSKHKGLWKCAEMGWYGQQCPNLLIQEGMEQTGMPLHSEEEQQGRRANGKIPTANQHDTCQRNQVWPWKRWQNASNGWMSYSVSNTVWCLWKWLFFTPVPVING